MQRFIRQCISALVRSDRFQILRRKSRTRPSSMPWDRLVSSPTGFVLAVGGLGDMGMGMPGGGGMDGQGGFEMGFGDMGMGDMGMTFGPAAGGMGDMGMDLSLIHIRRCRRIERCRSRWSPYH